jgi:hypothetical protein
VPQLRGSNNGSAMKPRNTGPEDEEQDINHDSEPTLPSTQYRQSGRVQKRSRLLDIYD